MTRHLASCLEVAYQTVATLHEQAMRMAEDQDAFVHHRDLAQQARERATGWHQVFLTRPPEVQT